MNRTTLILTASLLGLSACGEAEPGEGGILKASAPKVDPALVISGEVLATEGQTLDGAKVLACLTPRETCAQEAEGDLTVENGVGRYALVVPQAGDYHLTIWKDVDGDGTPNTGDILAFANNMEPVASGQTLSAMTAFVRQGEGMVTNPGGNPMGTAADLETAAAAVRSASLSGRWTQSSTGSELVWGPEIKFQAASATVGMGTNLGGTFGSGSATNTTIVYSYKPVQISRRMSLDVRPDGTFRWTADQQRQQGDCRALHQEKFGRISVEGDTLTFIVSDARQRCGGGEVKNLDLKDETYTLVRAGDGFRLTGENGVNWSFNPG